MADPNPHIFDGTKWLSLKGADGQPGPTTVSADAGNATRLGSDGRIYTPTVTPPAASTTPPITDAATAAVGTSAAYARADHVHQLPTLAALGAAAANHTHKLDDLTDVAVTTPATGQVVRYNGTQFVNAALAYTDITGTPAIPAAVNPSTVAGAADSAAGAVGTATTYARADHSHPFPTAAQVGAITQAQADARYVEVAGDTMTGPLTVATNLSVDTTGGVGIAEIASLPVFAAGASGPVLTLENTAGRAAIRLGTSATATNNIFIDSIGDGRLALRTGNVGTIPEQLIAVIGKSAVGWNTDGFTVSTAALVPYCQFAPSTSAITTNSLSIVTSDGASIANFTKNGIGFRTDGFNVLTPAGTTPYCQFGPLASAISTDAFTVRDTAAQTRLNVSTSGSRVVGPEVVIIDDAGYRLATFKDRALAIGTLDALGDAAAAQIVVVGDDLGGVAASAASTLAQSNTRATVSIRPSPYSGYTLAIGPESTNNAPYIQGVTYAGGSAASPVSINPFGGGIGIGLIPTVAGVEAEVGGDLLIRGAVNCSGNITSTGTAHAFAAGSIPSPAVIGNTPRTIAATGSAGFAGQMVWDDNFIYLRTTSGWKKVALTAI